MGRFASTAETYLRYREPYPPAFFALVAGRLGLKGDERLIDLGTGPGVLALGFAPFVGSVLGVDPEEEMLAEASANAERAGIALPLLAGRTEDLADDIGRFDLVTIGRALHWMDRPATLGVFERILDDDGAILTAGSSPAKDERNPWLETMERISRGWAPGGERHPSYREAWFEDTAFEEVDTISHAFTQPTTPELLVARVLTRSMSSPARLGDRVEACRAELLAALAPFFPDGSREETLIARATVVRRR